MVFSAFETTVTSNHILVEDFPSSNRLVEGALVFGGRMEIKKKTNMGKYFIQSIRY